MYKPRWNSHSIIALISRDLAVVMVGHLTKCVDLAQTIGVPYHDKLVSKGGLRCLIAQGIMLIGRCWNLRHLLIITNYAVAESDVLLIDYFE